MTVFAARRHSNLAQFFDEVDAADAAKAAKFGNKVRQHGVDRCWCGSKYWENDRCIDCGGADVQEDDS
jgi:hypothetical protein